MARVFENDKCKIDNMSQIKVLWICNFSNPEIRKKLLLQHRGLDYIVRKLLKLKDLSTTDFGIWNTNGINEIKAHPEISLYVISPHHNLSTNLQKFDMDGIHYYFYREQSYTLKWKILTKIFKKSSSFLSSRNIISKIVEEVRPDIVHIIGAENPTYSLAALDIPNNIPLIVQLQTLLNDPNILKQSVAYSETMLQCERKVIKRADFIGCSDADAHFRNVIEHDIQKGKRFLNLELPNGLSVQISNEAKEFDFVYFSANINKAFDLALEAFIVAHSINPSLKMEVIGYYDSDFKKKVDKLIFSNNLQDFIHFAGHQETYKEVLDLVKKCKIALLPLKIDLISSTIRESMALGLPVITTITTGTPELNKQRESVLLSEIGDYKTMSENMLKLVSDSDYFSLLQNNAAQTIRDMFDNSAAIDEWVEAYKTIVSH